MAAGVAPFRLVSPPPPFRVAGACATWLFTLSSGFLMPNVTGYLWFLLSRWHVSSSDDESSSSPGSGITQVLHDHVSLLSVSYPSVLPSSADDEDSDADDDVSDEVPTSPSSLFSSSTYADWNFHHFCGGGAGKSLSNMGRWSSNSSFFRRHLELHLFSIW